MAKQTMSFKKLKVNGDWLMVNIKPISMAESMVTIIVTKRVGQKVVWTNKLPGDFARCGRLSDSSVFCVYYIQNADYEYVEQNVYDIITLIHSTIGLFYKAINFDSRRASYELLRALS